MEKRDDLGGPADTRTLAQRVADRIRDAIVRGALPGGLPLRQAELAAQFGVSPIPLREALRQLEVEGFVTLHPYRGAVVSPVSVGEAREIAELRTILDTKALRLAFPKLTTETLRRAEELLDARDREQDFTRWMELDWDFKEVLFNPAGRPLLLSIIKGLHRTANRYYGIYVHFQRRQRQPSWGREVIKACRRGDVNAAVRVVEKVNAAAVAHLVKLLDGSLEATAREKRGQRGRSGARPKPASRSPRRTEATAKPR